jgi:histone acetyltransferase 1
MEFTEWTTPATSAFSIALTRNYKNVFDEPFSPAYTYFIFDKTEDLIFGYKKPRVDISFRANDMKPSVRISYKQKMAIDLPGVGEFVELNKLLENYFPADAFEETSTDAVTEWTPPGEVLHQYNYNGKRFEIWSASLSDRRAIEIIKNMKILIPMFIEGGTFDFLNDDDVAEERWTIERWKIFLLYQKDDANYTLVGFATSYRFEVFPTITEEDMTVESKSDTSDFTQIPSLPVKATPNSVRERISQFLILPPYQHQPHGIYLYQTMMNIFLSNPAIFEVTVEDPNEHFDNLRDYCDLSTLLSDSTFRNLKPVSSVPDLKSLSSNSPVPIDDILPKEIIPTLCTRHKMIQRQVERLIEMYLLHQIPLAHRARTRIIARKWKSVQEDDRRYYFWRLLVKRRVYIRNKEDLKEIEENERIERVESSVDSLQEHYQQLFEGFEKRVDLGYLTNATQNVYTVSGAERRVVVNGGQAMRKRKVIDSSEDDEDDDELPAKRQATEPLE